MLRREKGVESRRGSRVSPCCKPAAARLHQPDQAQPNRPASPCPALQVLPGWLTTVSMAVLLTYITYKMVRKAADLYSKERRSLTQSLRRLADVDAEGGDLVASLRTPLLGSLATLPGSGSSTDGSPALPRLVLSPPDSTHVSPAVPLMLRPDSARSGGTADEETGGAAGGAAATGAAAALMVAQAEEGLLPRASSQPLTIGAPQGSTPLPMLTPVL